jgi:two-component system, response regulator PdtaR
MDKLRVLIVDDDQLVVLLLEELLAEMGHEVCGTAATEADAVECALRYRPDLMIVDAGLATGSGISFVEEIGHRAQPAAHFFLSGDPEKVRARIPEAVVLGKPFRVAQLGKAIDAALTAAAGQNGLDLA